MQEVKLYNNAKEKAHLEDRADLFALLKATQHLERAFIKGWVAPEEYEKACEKLISQFKAHWSGKLREEVSDMYAFANTYNLSVDQALTRLVKVGMPATREHLLPTRTGADVNSGHAILKATEALIGAKDTLQLEMSAVDQIIPSLTYVLDALRALPRLPPDFDGYVKTSEWITMLNQRPAHYELSADEMRQLQFDLDQVYNSFQNAIQ